MVLKKTLQSPLDSKEIKLVSPKGNQPWIFIGRTDAEAEAPKLWLPDAKNWLTGKDPDAGKDWRQEEKGATEDEMVGWHHHSMETSVSKPQEIVRTGKPGVLQFMGSQRVRHDWATKHVMVLRTGKRRVALLDPTCVPTGSDGVYWILLEWNLIKETEPSP